MMYDRVETLMGDAEANEYLSKGGWTVLSATYVVRHPGSLYPVTVYVLGRVA
jgi:hypothetical protein